MEREERRWHRTAWQTAYLMNVTGKSLKKNVTPDQLLGRKKGRPRNPDADFKELMERQKKKLDAKAQD